MAGLYISDLDGTLLNRQGELSPYSRRELTRMLNEGLPFTVASGRSVLSIQSQKILGGIPLKLPVIEFDGAFISDLHTGKHHLCHNIERGIVEEIAAKALASGIKPFISSFNGQEDCLYYTSVDNDGMKWYVENRKNAKDPRLRKTEDITSVFDESIVCLTLIDNYENLIELHEWIKNSFPRETEIHFMESYYNQGWFWITVHDHRATKANGMKIVAEEAGIKMSEVTVFGDNINDISMLTAAGHSVVVENAEDGVKEHADEIIGDHDEDSVMKYLAGIY